MNKDYNYESHRDIPRSEEKYEKNTFKPDNLCPECLAIFQKGVFTYRAVKENTVVVYTDNPTRCRLCALLISRLCDENPRSDMFAVQYVVDLREGYVMDIFDLVFFLQHEGEAADRRVRLGIQQVEPKESSYPVMTDYKAQLPSSTGHEDSLGQVKNWMQICAGHHQKCQVAFLNRSFVPNRLLEIERLKSGDIRLRLKLTNKHDSQIEYSTLSHCWGSEMPFKLTKATLDTCIKRVPWENISPVFRDAVKVSLECGIRYIWIDSLCIIPDSIKDWESESALMGSIYMYGALNIAATGFANGTTGLYVKRDVETITPIHISTQNAFHLKGPDERTYPLPREYYDGNCMLVDIYTWKDNVDQSPLNRRGWVIQERALSPRTVHFGSKQIYWECLSSRASEVYPRGFIRGTAFRQHKWILQPRDRKAEAEEEKSLRLSAIENFQSYINDQSRKKHGGTFDWKSRIKWETEVFDWKSSLQPRDGWRKNLSLDLGYLSCLDDADIDHLPWDVEDVDELKAHLQKCREDRVDFRPWTVRGMTISQKKWVETIEIYSASCVSFSKDRIIAIAGLARLFSQDMESPYVVGMWRRDLEHQLLWKVIQAFPAPKDTEYRGPSWSWVSVDGPVEILTWQGHFYQAPGYVNWLTKLDGLALNSTISNDFIHAPSGTLTLTGPLGVIRLQSAGAVLPDPDDETIVQQMRHLFISWDNKELTERFSKGGWTDVQRYCRYGPPYHTKRKLRASRSLDVFYLPFRLMDYNVVGQELERPKLSGLLLLPTKKKNGEFRRVGHFELDGGLDGDISSLTPFTNKTAILDGRYYVSKEQNGDYTITVI